MNDRPKASVIVPTYNHAHYIKGAIDSLLNQTYQDFETIIVDDGSTDNTKSVLEPYGVQIKYIYQKNQGLAGARNTGIRAAGGRYIAFLDADDYFLKENLERKITFLEKNSHIDWVYSDWEYLDENGNQQEIGSIKWKYAEKDLTRRLFEELLIHRNFISPCTVIIKKNILEEAGYFDPHVICQEDWDLWLRLSQKYPSYYIDEVLVSVVVHPNSLSKNFSKWVSGNSIIVDKYKDLNTDKFDIKKSDLKKLQADKHTFLARDLIQKGRFKEGIGHYFKSVEFFPYQKRVYWLIFQEIINYIKR